MTNIVLGYILAIVSSFFHTLYIIPRKLSKQSPVIYIFYMSVGFLLSSFIVCIVHAINGYYMDFMNPVLIYAAIAGILSMIASICVILAIDEIGISRSNQWKNFQGPIGAGLIFFFFGEAQNTKISFLLLAIITIFISAMLLTIKEENKNNINKKGILYALGAALFYGINALMRKYTSDANLIYEQQLYSSIFMFLSALIYMSMKKDKTVRNITKKDNILAIFAGIIYYFATYFFITAYKYIQGSIAYTIVQLNTVFTIFFGIFIFKELSFKKHWKRIILGVIFSIMGLVMLMIAQK